MDIDNGSVAPYYFKYIKINIKKWSLSCGRCPFSVPVSPGNCRDVIYSDEGSTPADHVGDIKKKVEHNIV